ncbi:MAG: sulfonate ABC transporter permease, partial [Epulopiscium sp. Nele67-Bin002]
LFIQYVKDGTIFTHIKVSVWETVLGFSIGTILGILIAIILWSSDTLAKIMDPYLVVLNALPKTALAPIIIVWVGPGVKGIVVIAVTISLVTTVLSAYNYFINVEEDKVKMLKSFGATKLQILTKLILPSNIGNLINITKINIGLSWVGVIVGEFIVSRAGLGYLIVYGGQVFRLDLVMMGVVVLAVCALVMYQAVNMLEKLYYAKSNTHK